MHHTSIVSRSRQFICRIRVAGLSDRVSKYHVFSANRSVRDNLPFTCTESVYHFLAQKGEDIPTHAMAEAHQLYSD